MEEARKMLGEVMGGILIFPKQSGGQTGLS